MTLGDTEKARWDQVQKNLDDIMGIKLRFTQFTDYSPNKRLPKDGSDGYQCLTTASLITGTLK